MPLRARIETDVKPLDAFLQITADIERVYDELGREVFEEIHDPFLAELRYYPPPWTGGERDWQTPKQMAAYFASDGFGGGIPSTRSGDLAAAWDVTYIPGQGEFGMKGENKLPEAKFVVGSLDRRRGAAFQQRMHKATGWPLALETVDFWLEAASERLKEKFDRFLSAVASLDIRRRNR